MKSALRKCKALSVERRFHFLVALYPVLFRLQEGYPFNAVHETVAAFCESESIPFVDLLDAFSGQNERALWVHPVDQHPNETAHHLAAISLASSLRSMGFLPERLDRPWPPEKNTKAAVEPSAHQ
jgi:hypothetical protein